MKCIFGSLKVFSSYFLSHVNKKTGRFRYRWLLFCCGIFQK